MLSLLLFLLFLGVAYPDGIDYTTEDVDFPEECKSIAKPGDHIMIEYSLTSGSLEHAAQMQPENFHHVVLQDEDTLLHRTLKGMCENSTRLVRFTGGGDKVLVLPPILPSFRVSKEAGNTDLKVIVRHITQAEDYDIFHAMRVNNFSRVIDLIDEQRGGEWRPQFLISTTSMPLRCLSLPLWGGCSEMTRQGVWGAFGYPSANSTFFPLPAQSPLQLTPSMSMDRVFS